MEQTNKKSVRVHRVGSITAGMSMIAWGVMFLLYEVQVISDLMIVLKLWPAILIGLGIEILWFNFRGKNTIYDKGAVFIMILMSGFTIMMAIADEAMRLLYR